MKTANIIGRKPELRKLQQCYDSNQAQLVIVYGRRRVGKTFLIQEAFRDEFALRLTGAYNQPRKVQIANVVAELRRVYKADFPTPSTWTKTFALLRSFIESRPTDQRQVVFIDEIPWLDTPRSGFLPAFEYFWNSWGAQQSNLMLIACGSATAWMTQKFADNPGGLFNRHAIRLYLRPFTLAETEEYLQAQGINWSRYDVAECYMTVGGIPFYLSQLDNSLSYSANIDELLFRRKGGLWDEFKHLYSTLFRNSDSYLAVVEALAKKKAGLTRSEICAATKLANNGDLTIILQNLIDSDFVNSYFYFGKKSKDTLYQLCDNYTLFYYQFVRDHYGRDEHFWSHSLDSPARRTWAGYAFEMLCRQHIHQIKRKLSILGVLSEESVWYSKVTEPEARGAQIDIVIDRRDRVINLCEAKFSINQFCISKDYEMELRNKIDTFRRETGTTKALHLTMITTYGLKQNAHSSLVQSQVTLDDLFAPYEP